MFYWEIVSNLRFVATRELVHDVEIFLYILYC